MMYILGINGAYHESAACLITREGQLIAAVEEERFTRKRHGKQATVDSGDQLPIRSIEYCLNQAGAQWRDIEGIGFSINPQVR